MTMTKKEMEQLLDYATYSRNKMIEAVKDCLIKLKATSEETGVEFDWEESGAPSYASSAFGSDLADAYVTKIWFDKGLVKVNLHAYYLGDDVTNIDTSRECEVDWEDILEYLLGELEDDEPVTPHQEYYYVPFPDCQKYEELDGFDDAAVPTDDGAYFIVKDWVDSITNGSYYEKQ